MDMQNEGGTIFSKKIERYVRKTLILPLFVIILGMVVDILAREWGG